MHDDFPSPAIWFTHRISYGETDTMGVLYYAEYLHIFERARSEFIRACGMSYRDVEEKDIILPVREAQCRYRAPARYDDLVQVHTAISEWGRASMRFVYEMWNEDKTRLLATGSTQHALVNRQGRPVAVPDWLNNRNLKYRDNDESSPDNLTLRLRSIEQETKLRMEHTSTWNTWKVNAGVELNQTHYTNDTYQQIFIDTLSVYNYHTLLNLFRWGVFGSVGYTSSDERFSASLGLRSDGNNYSGRMKNMLKIGRAHV